MLFKAKFPFIYKKFKKWKRHPHLKSNIQIKRQTKKLFKPCYHDGNIFCNPSCHDGNKCEASCSCSFKKCGFAFKGCSCGKTCYGRSCPCRCDDRLCSQFTCANCSLCENNKNKMYNSPKFQFRLVVGKSNIHGWGLFTLDFIPEGSFIREYTGEYLENEEEISRRGRQNIIIRTTYMFCLVENVTIDSMYMGNKARFCNHSSIYDNLIVRIINDSGINRIFLFAKRNIKKYEELLFNYQIDKIEIDKEEVEDKNETNNEVQSDNETKLDLIEVDKSKFVSNISISTNYSYKYLNQKRSIADEKIVNEVVSNLDIFYIDYNDLINK